MQKLKSILIGRGRAFAPPSRNSPSQSTSVNALPSLLSAKIYPCGLGIVGKCSRFRAEHSRCDIVCKLSVN